MVFAVIAAHACTHLYRKKDTLYTRASVPKCAAKCRHFIRLKGAAWLHEQPRLSTFQNKDPSTAGLQPETERKTTRTVGALVCECETEFVALQIGGAAYKKTTTLEMLSAF